MTVREAKQHLIQELEAVTESPVFEANELLIAATGEDRGSLLFEPDKKLGTGQKLALELSLVRRKRGVPLQYILKEWEFYSITLRVGAGVLIPRAETELLVDLALEELSGGEHTTVFDLCAGSGAVGIAVARHCPEATVTLVEKSRRAFRYLRHNCQKNGVTAETVRADIARWRPKQKADLILCNPPYITADEMKALQREVRREPTMALYGGRDGLRFYRLLCERAALLLREGGRLLVEIGCDQAEAVCGLLYNAGFQSIETAQDLSGKDRVVSATLTIS